MSAPPAPPTPKTGRSGAAGAPPALPTPVLGRTPRGGDGVPAASPRVSPEVKGVPGLGMDVLGAKSPKVGPAGAKGARDGAPETKAGEVKTSRTPQSTPRGTPRTSRARDGRGDETRRRALRQRQAQRAAEAALQEAQEKKRKKERRRAERRAAKLRGQREAKAGNSKGCKARVIGCIERLTKQTALNQGHSTPVLPGGMFPVKNTMDDGDATPALLMASADDARLTSWNVISASACPRRRRRAPRPPTYPHGLTQTLSANEQSRGTR